MKENHKEIGYIYSFDIETNQYYDYSAWQNATTLDAEDAAKPGAEIFFKVVSEVVSEYATKLPQDCLEGSKVAEDAYHEIFSKIVSEHEDFTTEERDAVKILTIDLLDKYFPHIPTKVQTYLATFVCIPWDMRRKAVDGSVHGKFWYEYTADELKNELQNATVITCTTENEINDVFKEIYSEGKDNPNIVLIHNLSYEFNNCIRRLPFFKKMVEENKIRFLSNNAKDSVKSMEFYDSSFKPSGKSKKKRPKPVVYFRDTWKLTCMSIDKLGKIHKFPKLPYEYGVIRNPDDLTDKDFEYNRRDCDIAILGFHDAWTQATDVLNCRYEQFGSIPVSANNIVSSIAKTQFADEFEHHSKRVQPEKHDESGKLVSKTGANHLSYDMFKKFRKVTGGGLVFVNPFFAYTKFEAGKSYTTYDPYSDSYDRFTVKEIRHIDLISAHPSQAFKRFFPTQAPVKIPEAAYPTIKKLLKLCREEVIQTASISGIQRGLDRFSTLTQRLNISKASCKDSATSGFAKFTFKNLRPKEFSVNKSKYSLPCLWAGKITTKLSGTNEANLEDYSKVRGIGIKEFGSKLYCAESASIHLKFEDFLAIACLFYDFDDFEIEDVHLYAMGMISPYLYKQFAALGEKKNAYKAINKALGKGDLQAARDAAQCKQVLEAHRQLIEECSGTAEEMAVLFELSGPWLAAAKAQFNGVYGSSYQGLERDASDLGFDESGEIVWNKHDPKYDEENKSGIDYLQGAYIATWSRVDIALYTYLLASEKAIPLYVATDSVYYLVTQYTTKNLDSVLGLDLPADQYEDRAFNKPVTELFRERPNVPQIGGMDNENPITVIGYTQALKLICQEKVINKATGEIELHDCITFSGTTAEKDIIDEDGNELTVGFFAGCNDIHSKIERLFQEFGVYTKYDMFAKNKKTAGTCDSDGSYELVGQSFVNNDPGDEKYQVRKTFCDMMGIAEV